MNTAEVRRMLVLVLVTLVFGVLLLVGLYQLLLPRPTTIQTPGPVPSSPGLSTPVSPAAFTTT